MQERTQKLDQPPTLTNPLGAETAVWQSPTVKLQSYARCEERECSANPNAAMHNANLKLEP